jgi:hypothetical protein
MNIQTMEKNARPKGSRVKWLLAGGCSTVLLLIVGCIAVWFLMFRGRGGELATASVAERITKEFVQALHDRDLEAAHQTFSEKVRSEITTEDISLLLENNENRAVFVTYQNLEVCDWGFFMSDDGRVISAKGLIHYSGGDLVFESDLCKDSDTVWRIYGFWLKPEIEPEPFGRCR